MIAARIHEFGQPDVIAVEEVDRPSAGPGELLVRVAAAGVGPWDAWIRTGTSKVQQTLPLTLGSDLSGVVVELGDHTAGFEVGQPIFGVANARFTGSYAQYAAVDSAMVAPRPKGLSDTQAAAVPVVAVTALQMLFDHARVEPKQRVLVHGAGGNVGACAVQLARNAGAFVIGSEIGPAVEYVKTLGANKVLDATSGQFEDLTGEVDVVIDTVGGELLQARSLAILKPGGILVSSVGQPGPSEVLRRGVRGVFMLVEVTAAALKRITPAIEDGTLVIRVGTELPLDQARKAHEMLDGLRAHAPGKIVLNVPVAAS